MWIADGWKDYELLDASGGERLERWGTYLLARPDPQVLWDTGKHGEWERIHARYHRSKAGGGSWEIFDLPDRWEIGYTLQSGKTLSFSIQPFSFKHTGVFPEQAANWEWTSAKIEAYPGEAKILNLFAYTGGATIAAASAGGNVTHVDASKGMVTVAHENAIASGLAEAPIRWIVDDCVKFVEREIRRGNTYQGIIMDPPSYGRGPKGELWKFEECIFDLIGKCASLLAEDAFFFIINSYTAGLQPGVLTYMVREVLKERGGETEAQELGLMVKANGSVLPCGVTCRWTRS